MTNRNSFKNFRSIRAKDASYSLFEGSQGA
jgi:hypothetical protein